MCVFANDQVVMREPDYDYVGYRYPSLGIIQYKPDPETRVLSMNARQKRKWQSLVDCF